MMGDRYLEVIQAQSNRAFITDPEYFYGRAVFHYLSSQKNNPMPKGRAFRFGALSRDMKKLGLSINEETIKSRSIICSSRKKDDWHRIDDDLKMIQQRILDKLKENEDE